MKITRLLKTLIILLLIGALASTAAAAPYTRTKPLIYTMEYRYSVVNRSTEEARDIRVTIPGAHAESFSNQEIISTKINRELVNMWQDARGNLTLEVAIAKLAPGAKTEIVLQYLVRNYAVYFDLSVPGGSFPAPHSSYLKPEEKIESDHPEIVAKAKEITQGKYGTVERARAIFAFVQQYMTYSSSFANKGALSALRNGTGVCEDYAALFVALCRSSGIPARLVFGNRLYETGDIEGHAWAEFFLSSHSWVPVEPTVISTQVPWDQFGAITDSLRQFPFSLSGPAWSWKWFGGNVNVSCTTSLKPGQLIPLFTDIDNHWAYNNIDYLVRQGIISGYEGLFYPESTLTRAEFAKMIVLANGLSPDYGYSPFTDVKPNDWYYPYVLAAAKAGLFSGMGDRSFRPAEPINREQLAAVIARSLGFNGIIKGKVFLPFIDSTTISSWAVPYVQYTVNSGLLQGDNQNLFRPLDDCSRAEAAVIGYRYLTQ